MWWYSHTRGYYLKRKNPDKLRRIIGQNWSAPSYSMLIVASVLVILDVRMKWAESPSCWSHIRLQIAGGTLHTDSDNSKNSGKTSCKMLYLCPNKGLGRMQSPYCAHINGKPSLTGVCCCVMWVIMSWHARIMDFKHIRLGKGSLGSE